MAVYDRIGLVGGVIGGLLLLELPAKVFEFAVPPLILFSALIIALNPRRKAAARDAVARALPQSYQAERAARIADATTNGALCDDPWWLWVGVSFVGVYSGYFGAAAGTLALAILDLGKIGPFHQINALKTVVGFGANISAAIMFIIRGSVYWPFAIMMCIGCTIGSAIAPPITRRIPEGGHAGRRRVDRRHPCRQAWLEHVPVMASAAGACRTDAAVRRFMGVGGET